MAENDTLTIDLTGIPMAEDVPDILAPSVGTDDVKSPVTGEMVNITPPSPKGDDQETGLSIEAIERLEGIVDLEGISEITSPISDQRIGELEVDSPYSVLDPRHPDWEFSVSGTLKQSARELLYGANAFFKAAFPLLWAEAGIAGPIDAIQNKESFGEILKSIPENYKDYGVSIIQDIMQSRGRHIPQEELVRAKTFSDNWATYYKITTGEEAPLWYKTSAGIASLLGLSVASATGRKLIQETGKVVSREGREATKLARELKNAPGVTRQSKEKIIKRVVDKIQALPEQTAETIKTAAAHRKMLKGLTQDKTVFIEDMVKRGMSPVEAERLGREIIREILRPQVQSGGLVDTALLKTYGGMVKPISAQVEQAVVKKGAQALFEVGETIVAPTLPVVTVTTIPVKTAEASIFAELIKSGVFEGLTVATTSEGLKILTEAGVDTEATKITVAVSDEEVQTLADEGMKTGAPAVEGAIVVDEEITTSLQSEALKHKTATDFIEAVQSLPEARQPAGLLAMTPEAQEVTLTQVWEQVTEAEVAGTLKPIPAPKVTRKAPVSIVKPKKKFRKPTPLIMVTPQNKIPEILGVKKFVEPLERGRMKLDKEELTLVNEIKTVVKQVEKLKTMTTEEMALLLNTNVNAPKNLDEKETASFEYFRNLTQEILRRTNESREKTGREPIKDIGAYFRHIGDVNAEEVLTGIKPMPEIVKKWANENISDKVRNTMETQRKIKDELLKHFSKDLGKVMISMVRTGLKEIHLDEAKQIHKTLMAGAQKDIKIRESLSAEEKIEWDAQEDMPEATRKWMDEYIKIVLLKDKQTTVDETFNNALAPGTKAGDFVNKQLERFGKHLSERQFTDMMVALSQAPLFGLLGPFNPKQLLRNKMQVLQNVALYGPIHTYKGLLPTSEFSVLEQLKKDSLFMQTYTGIETIPAELVGKLKKINFAAFQWTAVTNASQAMNAAYFWAADHIQNPKLKKLGWADPQRIPEDFERDLNFFYPSEKEILLKEMEWGAQTTQYQYIAMAMPQIFRYKAFAPFTRLMSWWMNHLFNFNREALHRAIRGEVGYTIRTTMPGPSGEKIEVERKLKLSKSDQTNYWQYVIFVGAVLKGLGYGRSFLKGTVPTSLPPAASLIINLGLFYFTPSDSDFNRNKRAGYLRDAKRAALTYLPASLTVKDATKFVTGQQTLLEYLFYTPSKSSGSVNI